MSESATSTESVSAPKVKVFFGQKVGMTQIYDGQGTLIPVTVVHAGSCRVVQVFSRERHGYGAIQVGLGEVKAKSVNRPDAGQFKKAGIPGARWIREIRTEKAAEFKVGQSLSVDVFAPGDFVDVSGVSKGKGFAGVMKRHNFGGGPSTHGQSDRARAPGSSGSNTYPARVYKGKKFPGHLGAERVTVQHLEIVGVHPDKEILVIRGAIPGPRQGLVEIRQTVKRLKAREKVEPTSRKEKAVKKEAPKAKGGK